MNKSLDRFLYPDSYLNLDEQFKRLFVIRPDIIIESDNYQKNRHTFSSKLSDFCVNFHLRALHLKNVSSKPNSNYKDQVIFNNPLRFRGSPKERESISSFFLVLLGAFFLLYLVTKLSISNFFKLYLEYNWLKNSTKTSNISRTDSCETAPHKWHPFQAHLVSLGYPSLNLDASIPLSMNFMIILMLVFMIIVSIFFSQERKVRLCCQLFIRDPNGVVDELEYQLEGIIETLMNSMKEYQRNILMRENHALLSWIGKKGARDKIHQSKYPHKGSIMAGGDSSGDYLNFVENLYRTLHDIRSLRLVHPHHVSSKAHLLFTRVNCLFFIVSYIEGAMICVPFILLVIWLELQARVSRRIQCFTGQNSGLHSEVDFTNQVFYLPNLTNQDHISTYSNYMNQTETGNSLLPLMSIEFEYYANWRVILFWVEFCIIFIIDLSTVSFTSNVYYQELIYRGLWVRNLVMQIKCCINRLMKVKLSDRNEDKFLERCLLITYLNYNLFRKGHKVHQKFIKIMLISYGAMTLFTMYLTYIFRIYLSASAIIFSAYLATGCLSIFNIFLLLATAYLEENNILHALINRLVIVGSLHSMEGSYIMDLFRRIILTNKEVEKMYAPSLFGFKVSYANIFYLNFYMCVLWYLVY